MTYCMIVTTCPNREEALMLSKELVSSKLAACAQIHSIESVYSWQDAIHHDPEFRLIIKTRQDLYSRIESFIVQHHSYDLPQIIQIPIDGGSVNYLNWIEQETTV